MPPDRQTRRDETDGSSGWFFDSLVLGLAAWTVAAHAVVFLGGSLHVLTGVALCLVPAALFGGARLRANADTRDARARSAARVVSQRRDGRGASLLERGLVLLVAGIAAGLCAVQPDWSAAWLIGLPLVALLVLREVHAGSNADSAPEHGVTRGQEKHRVLWLLAAVCCALTLLAKRPDADDAFYVNMAVAVADHPGAPMLAADTMHGIEGVALPLALYRLQSYELLAGLAAWLTPLGALDWIHLVLPALVALMIPFALARLLRLLAPRAWIWAVFFALLYLWCVGDPHRSFGNFAFVRLQQGKAILVSLVLPLVTLYGVLFARRPDRYHWLLLVSVQIVALGMSITSLWLAPVCAGLGVCMGIGTGRQLPGVSTSVARGPANSTVSMLGRGLLASFYPVSAALLLRSSTLADFEVILGAEQAAGQVPVLSLGLMFALFAGGLFLACKGGALARRAWTIALVLLLIMSLLLALAQAGVPGISVDSASWLGALGVADSGLAVTAEAAEFVLGRGGFGGVLLFLILGGWALARGVLLRRLFALHGLALLGIFWNPWTAEALSAGVIGQPTYWRVFWLLPAACMVGAALATTIEASASEASSPGRRRLGVSLACLLCGLALWVLPAYTTLSSSNDVQLGRPGWRIPRAELEASRALVEYSPAGSRVLAPFPVSEWIPAFHHHPFPLIVRLYYKRMLLDVLPGKEFRRRVKLTRMVSQPAITEFQTPEKTLDDFRTAIDDFALAAICISRGAFVGAVRPALNASPLKQVFENEKYLVWARP